jgi:Peptidyl-tRNA hydrolase
LGFLVVDELARELGVTVWRGWMESLVAKTKLDDVDVLLVKPLTYMNLSGEAVQPILRYYRGQPGDLLVIYDDLDLPPGQLRLRPSGSSGGHRGVQSVIDMLGTNAFARLRIGIGRPPEPLTAAEYVLQPLSPAEMELFAAAIRTAAAAARTWVLEGTEAAMNKYNRASS